MQSKRASVPYQKRLYSAFFCSDDQQLDDSAGRILLQLLHVESRDAVGVDAVALLHAPELAQRLIGMIGWGNAALLEELAVTITETALCGLGKSAALPVMSTLKLFREEYLEHVVDKHCASHTCTAMRRFVISPERCKGCSKCAKNCPADAISGKIKEPYVIDNTRCIKCGACESSCAFGAIHVEW